MPLVNMKISKKEAKEKESPIGENVDRYPWGLGIHLDEDSIEKLGLTDLPEVGDSKMLVAYVDITETSENESISGKKRRSIRLQITDMSLEEKVKKDKLKTLYDNESKK